MFEGLKNLTVFENFAKISQIPRGSGNEKAISDYLVSFAKEHGLYAVQDGHNNVMIRKTSVPGGAYVSLQGHIDMVCEKVPGCTHDFLKDPIKLIRDGDILSADGTTLGADNGVAVAMMMTALCEDDPDLPNLECVFTTEEETGMGGTKNFDFSSLLSKKMINLDSTGVGIATAACAGGVRTDFTYTAPKNVSSLPDGFRAMKLTVDGLFGGHSGEDINLGRANAIVTLVRIIEETGCGVCIYGMSGGDKDNAIPRRCEAVIASDGSFADKAEAVAEHLMTKMCRDDSSFSFTCEECAAPGHGAFDCRTSAALLDTLYMFRPGPVRMSSEVPDMVETSYNLANIRTDKDTVKFTVSSRSSDERELDHLLSFYDGISRLTGVRAESHDRYPGWKFDSEGTLRDIFRSSFRKVAGREAQVIGIHAGLECGYIKSVVNDMDILSIGPDIRDLHSPSETLSLSSLDLTYDLLTDMLHECKKESERK